MKYLVVFLLFLTSTAFASEEKSVQWVRAQKTSKKVYLTGKAPVNYGILYNYNPVLLNEISKTFQIVLDKNETEFKIILVDSFGEIKVETFELVYITKSLADKPILLNP